MKTKNKLPVIIAVIVSLTSLTTVMQAQAIKINTYGSVGINGSPYNGTYYPFKVNGQAYFTSRIYAKNNLTFSGSSNYITGIEYIYRNTEYGKITFNGNYIKIYGGNESAGKALDIFGDVHVDGILYHDSDEKLKDNITALDGVTILEKINRLEGKKYKFKSYEELVKMHDNGEVIYSVDTVNLYKEAEHFAMKDKNFAKEFEKLNDVERKSKIRSGYFDKAKELISVHKMINDSMAIVVNAPRYTDKEHFGFLAQDVIKEFPELVKEDTVSGLLSVNYIGFIPLLLESIKEQNKRIATLEKELEKLKGRK